MAKGDKVKPNWVAQREEQQAKARAQAEVDRENKRIADSVVALEQLRAQLLRTIQENVDEIRQNTERLKRAAPKAMDKSAPSVQGMLESIRSATPSALKKVQRKEADPLAQARKEFLEKTPDQNVDQTPQDLKKQMGQAMLQAIASPAHVAKEEKPQRTADENVAIIKRFGYINLEKTPLADNTPGEYAELVRIIQDQETLLQEQEQALANVPVKGEVDKKALKAEAAKRDADLQAGLNKLKRQHMGDDDDDWDEPAAAPVAAPAAAKKARKVTSEEKEFIAIYDQVADRIDGSSVKAAVPDEALVAQVGAVQDMLKRQRAVFHAAIGPAKEVSPPSPAAAEPPELSSTPSSSDDSFYTPNASPPSPEEEVVKPPEVAKQETPPPVPQKERPARVVVPPPPPAAAIGNQGVMAAGSVAPQQPLPPLPPRQQPKLAEPQQPVARAPSPPPAVAQPPKAAVPPPPPAVAQPPKAKTPPPPPAVAQPPKAAVPPPPAVAQPPRAKTPPPPPAVAQPPRAKTPPPPPAVAQPPKAAVPPPPPAVAQPKRSSTPPPMPKVPQMDVPEPPPLPPRQGERVPQKPAVVASSSAPPQPGRQAAAPDPRDRNRPQLSAAEQDAFHGMQGLAHHIGTHVPDLRGLAVQYDHKLKRFSFAIPGGVDNNRAGHALHDGLVNVGLNVVSDRSGHYIELNDQSAKVMKGLVHVSKDISKQVTDEVSRKYRGIGLGK